MSWEKIWSWIEKNRFTVLLPVIGGIIWLIGVGCTPITQSPFTPDRQVTATELEQEYLIWQKENEIVIAKFEAAGKDLQQQAANQAKVLEVITTLASGSVADWPGLVQLLLGSGVVGLLADNIRKNGVIGGLKRNA
jgi:hypothetical protein